MPEDVGIPRLDRRRVKGLRRSEVADLAAVSLTWYTWIEQGRDIRISADVLDALARALKLDEDAWRHIRRLSGVPVTDSQPPPVEVSSDLRNLLSDLLPSPAYITTSAFDLAAWNQAYVALFNHDPAKLPMDRRNGLWAYYMSQSLRTGLENWEAEAQKAVARFRVETARMPNDERARAVVAELTEASPEFRTAWKLHQVRGFVGSVQAIDNPQVGLIRMQVMQFRPAHQPALTLMIHRPSDAVSRDRLSTLLATGNAEPTGSGSFQADFMSSSL
jgi:transcriptional regulator with XRE-family HTH domain